MSDAGIRGQGSFLLQFFKILRDFALAQLLSSIVAIPFFKLSKLERLRNLSTSLMFNLIPMFFGELIDRIINNDKPDLLHLAIFRFDWFDLLVFIINFIGSCIGFYYAYRNQKRRLDSPQNEKNQA